MGIISRPHLLMDELLKTLGEPDNLRLSNRLGILPSTLSKIRNRVIDVSDSTIVSIHEETGWSIKKIKELIEQSKS